MAPSDLRSRIDEDRHGGHARGNPLDQPGDRRRFDAPGRGVMVNESEGVGTCVERNLDVGRPGEPADLDTGELSQ